MNFVALFLQEFEIIHYYTQLIFNFIELLIYFKYIEYINIFH